LLELPASAQRARLRDGKTVAIMHWRRLREGELDHELLWLVVTLSSALVWTLWLQSGLPTPRCMWHELTGWPCVGCGGTRCVRHALAGDWLSAFRMNPLIFATLGAVVIYDAYATVVLAFRLPRLRFGKWPAWAGWTIRGVVVAVLLANWAWLIVRGV
jgi:hypothetical protein